jgi:hypothetical protein
MAEKNSTAWVKWAIGIVLPIILMALTYSINLNLENEARMTTVETEIKQVRGELDDIWGKYNNEQGNKIEFIGRLIILEQKIETLEHYVEELKHGH